jgi:hypothetical protein
VLAGAGLAAALGVSPASAPGQQVTIGPPGGTYRTVSVAVAGAASGLRLQRDTFATRLDVVQAEIGRLTLALDAQRAALKGLDDRVIQAHLNKLAAEHLVYEARRREAPDLADHEARAEDRRLAWERLEADYRARADAGGLLERLKRTRAEAADLLLDWNLANDRLRLLEKDAASARPEEAAPSRDAGGRRARTTPTRRLP